MPADPPSRYSSDAREMRKTTARMPWRTRTRQAKPTLHTRTPAEKKAALVVAHQRKLELSSLVTDALVEVWKIAEGLWKETGKHSINYWYEFLIQRAGKNKKKRATSNWNAFVSKKVRAHNDALPLGAPRVKATTLMPELQREWHELSLAEQDAYTDDVKEHLEAVREMKEHAVHNVSINAFHDVRATLASVYQTLENLSARTGTEIMIIGSRSDASSFLVPFTWSTSDKIDDHFQMKFKMSASQYASQVECFLLSGLEGTVQKAEAEIVALKKQLSELIIEKLQLVARPNHIARMYYRDFDTHITHKLGIVVRNWPLTSFVSPSHVGSRVELDTLYHAWKSGATYFERLSDTDFAEWRRQRAEERMQVTAPVAALSSVVPVGPANLEQLTPIASGAELPHGVMPPPPPPPSPVSAPATFVGTPFSVTNNSLAVKTRKTRSDKGKKRGPRK